MNELHAACLMYAVSYSEVLMKRLEKEKEDFFEEAGITKREMVAHLTNNLCLPYTKLKSQAYRSAAAKLKEKKFLTDEIRRLYNGGDQFHPYFWASIMPRESSSLVEAWFNLYLID